MLPHSAWALSSRTAQVTCATAPPRSKSTLWVGKRVRQRALAKHVHATPAFCEGVRMLLLESTTYRTSAPRTGRRMVIEWYIMRVWCVPNTLSPPSGNYRSVFSARYQAYAPGGPAMRRRCSAASESLFPAGRMPCTASTGRPLGTPTQARKAAAIHGGGAPTASAAMAGVAPGVATE